MLFIIISIKFKPNNSMASSHHCLTNSFFQFMQSKQCFVRFQQHSTNLQLIAATFIFLSNILWTKSSLAAFHLKLISANLDLQLTYSSQQHILSAATFYFQQQHFMDLLFIISSGIMDLSLATFYVRVIVRVIVQVMLHSCVLVFCCSCF